MDEERTAFIEQAREFGHGVDEALVNVFLRIFSIRHGQPDPFHPRLARHFPVKFRIFDILQEGDNVRASFSPQCVKHLAARTVV